MSGVAVCLAFLARGRPEYLLHLFAAFALIGISSFVTFGRFSVSAHNSSAVHLPAVNIAAAAVLYFYPFVDTTSFAVLLALLGVAGFVSNYRLALILISAIAVLYAVFGTLFALAPEVNRVDFFLRLTLIFCLALTLAALVSRRGPRAPVTRRSIFTQDLVSFGRHLTRSLDEEQVVAKCPRAVRDIMKCDAVEMLLMEGETVRKGSFCADDAPPLSDDSTHSGLLCAANVQLSDLPDLSFQSRLVTRLQSDAQDFGELRIYYKDSHRWTEEEHLKFDFIGAQTAMALQMAQLFRKIENQARTDSLTDLCNRRYFHERLEEELERSRRKHRECTIVLIDLDQFKQVNDTHGHAQGDKVLTHVAQLLKRTTRSTDLIARYGGDEFTMLLPETHPARAKMLVERLRNELECHPVACGLIRLSAGIAAYPHHAADVRQLLEHADRALYKAKELGRNRTETYSE